VADDELSVPLGKSAKKEQRRFRLPIRIPHMIAGLLGLFVLACTAWALMVDDPFGGEPIAVVATGFDPPKSGPALPTVVSAQGPRSYDGPDAPASKQAPAATPAQPAAAPLPAANPNTKTVTIIDGSTGKRQEVPISGARDIRAPLEQRLLETSRHGAIPRIAPDGARPAELYARAAAPLQGKKEGPRVAIVIGGLGVSANVTRQATEKLPGPVTFAFTPYGTDVEGMVTSARAAGHEVLLQAPMEPFDYPDNDPGPQTLLTTLAPEQNIDRLYWHLSRLQGYAGIANFMGARFVATDAVMAPIIREAAKRGLGYLDDGSTPRSAAPALAAGQAMPFAKADFTIDAVPTSAEIDRTLIKLETLAKERGLAVGVASALPISIERIAAWIKTLYNRGIMLVPLTTAMLKSKSG